MATVNDYKGLLVWMPLNGNIRNLGLVAGSSMYNGGTSQFTAGKIGLAYTYKAGTFPQGPAITLGNAATVMGWIKTSTSGGMLFGIPTNANGNLNIGNWGPLCLNIGDSSDNPFKDDSGNNIGAINDGVWHHMVFVFDGTNCKYYKDGTYQGKAKTYRNPTSTNKVWSIGSGGSSWTSYITNGQFNDFRVYNYALDANLVKEISKGLVGHWPLNEDLTNIFNLPTITYGSATWACVLVHNNPANNMFANKAAGACSGNYGDDLYSRLHLLSGSNFKTSDGKLEFLALEKTTSSDSETVRRWKQTNSPVDTTSVTGFENVSNGTRGLVSCNGNTYLAHTNTTSDWWGSSGCYTKYNGGIPGIGNQLITSGYLKLYVRIDNIVKGKIHSIEGFHNDLTPSGSPGLTGDTKRYERAMEGFSSANYLHGLDTSTFIKNQVTLSLWAKFTSTPTAIAFMAGQGKDNMMQGYSLMFYSSGVPRFSISTNTSTGIGNEVISSKTMDANKWYHLCGTYDGTTAKIYVNGELKGSKALTGNIDFTNSGTFVVGKMGYGYTSSTTYYPFTNGKLSDIRLYATALSADAVKELASLGTPD